MAPYHPPSGGRRNKLRLDFNENTVGASPLVLDFIKRYLTAADLTIYPEYQNALEDLSRYFGVQETELTLTNGTDEAIQLLINTFVDDNDEVLILRPSYAMYRFYSQLAVPAWPKLITGQGKLAFPWKNCSNASTPHTRSYPDQQSQQSNRYRYRRFGPRENSPQSPARCGLVDEAYYEFCGVTMLNRLREHTNLFVSRTFSKVYRMAAMRCGCLFSQATNMAYIAKSPIAL